MVKGGHGPLKPCFVFMHWGLGLSFNFPFTDRETEVRKEQWFI
jgi:hypothetical protein